MTSVVQKPGFTPLASLGSYFLSVCSSSHGARFPMFTGSGSILVLLYASALHLTIMGTEVDRTL